MPKLVDVVRDHSDPVSANLSVLEFSNLPWQPQRLYWLSAFETGKDRGNHAHRKLSQLFVVVSGYVDIEIFHGVEKETFSLKANGKALLLTPGAWRVITNPSPDAIVLVIADAPYDESDYIRDWNEYLEWFSSFKKNTE